MRGRGFLAAFYKRKARFIDVALLKAQVSYMMYNPVSFLHVTFLYDPSGKFGRTAKLPEGVDTKGKIFVMVIDNRGVWSDKSGIPVGAFAG